MGDSFIQILALAYIAYNIYFYIDMKLRVKRIKKTNVMLEDILNDINSLPDTK